MYQYYIERRLTKLHAFSYILSHPKYSRTIEYIPRTGEDYTAKCSTGLGDDFISADSTSIWQSYRPNKVPLPQSGYKIHLSSYYAEADNLLVCILPILKKYGLACKILTHESLLNLSNSTFMSISAAGKFVTIYPRDNDQFEHVNEIIYQATRNFDGPRIASDKRYKDSNIVFYRYGAFHKFSKPTYSVSPKLC